MVLADFGCASIINNKDFDICLYGKTTHYRSPEIIVHALNAVSCPTDVWSAGCIILNCTPTERFCSTRAIRRTCLLPCRAWTPTIRTTSTTNTLPSFKNFWAVFPENVWKEAPGIFQCKRCAEKQSEPPVHIPAPCDSQRDPIGRTIGHGTGVTSRDNAAVQHQSTRHRRKGPSVAFL